MFALKLYPMRLAYALHRDRQRTIAIITVSIKIVSYANMNGACLAYEKYTSRF